MAEYTVKDIDYRETTFKEEVFNSFYDEYYKKVYNFIFFKTGDRFLSEDLTSGVIEKVLYNIQRFDEGKSNLNTWVFTVARNSIIDHYRLKCSGNTYFKDGEELGIEDTVSVRAEDNLLLREKQETIARLLQILSEQEREIIILKFWGGLKNIEIAEQLGIKGGNIGVIIFRALKKLKKHIDEKKTEF